MDKKNVKLLPGVFRERMEKNREYLMELDPQCLCKAFIWRQGL